MPVLGQDIASIAWQYPAYRNMTLRLMEPLGALEEQASPDGRANQRPASLAALAPAAISLRNVTVCAGGHTILEDVSAEIPAGSHIGIVGPSGAGKSSFAGTLLGWWRPAAGEVLFDGEPLTGSRLEELRRATAWVDPEVHLWNRAFLDNIRYGTTDGGGRSLAQVVEAAELRRVLERLPEGFETRLGEGGALVSGGEGQRVRLARALFRPDTRLVILDEPFRGLDREQRRDLLGRVRRIWHGVTLLCITHDLEETLAFDRVLVIEGGRIVEDGRPAMLAASEDSRYAALLAAERALRRETWSDAGWQRLRLENGLIRAGDGAS
jgi:ABC-type multidrug transport system fused ATPase/permease subunit